MSRKRISVFRTGVLGLLCLGLLSAILLSCTTLSGAADGPEIDARFFYLEICAACENYQLADELNGLLVSSARKYSNVNGRGYNLAVPENSDKLVEIVEERELPDVAYLSPVLIVNSFYIIGYDEIDEAIRELYSTGTIKHLFPESE